MKDLSDEDLTNYLRMKQSELFSGHGDMVQTARTIKKIVTEQEHREVIVQFKNCQTLKVDPHSVDWAFVKMWKPVR